VRLKVAVWLSGNALVSIHVVALHRARCLTKSPMTTQPGHPSVSIGAMSIVLVTARKKRRVLRNSTSRLKVLVTIGLAYERG